MKLIKAKYPFDDDVVDIDVDLNCETHGRVKMNRKQAHLVAPLQPTMLEVGLVLLQMLLRVLVLLRRPPRRGHGASMLLRRFCA